MEEAFSQLKQITGVSSLVDMHEKFSSQRGNKGNLLQETKGDVIMHYEYIYIYISITGN
jgi:hypothetical protein